MASEEERGNVRWKYSVIAFLVYALIALPLFYLDNAYGFESRSFVEIMAILTLAFLAVLGIISSDVRKKSQSMDKKITSIGAILFASGIFVWILNIQLGLGLHYEGNIGNIIEIVQMALSVFLLFFGIVFIILGITPNPPDITEDSPS
jgi:hypothetical protein